MLTAVLRGIAAEGPGAVYFRDGGRRAHGLAVEFTDIEHLEFEL
ncbi:terminal protein [Streptomyces sp. NWU339]